MRLQNWRVQIEGGGGQRGGGSAAESEARWARCERRWSHRSHVQPAALRISRGNVSLPTSLTGCLSIL